MLGWLRLRGYRFVALAEAFDAMLAPTSPGRIVALTFDDGYQDFITHALPVLERHRCPATAFVTSGLMGGRNDWDAGNEAPAMLFGRREARELVSRGIDFGSHSATHPHLTRLPQPARSQEIEGSRRDLEAAIEQSVRWFAYPFADHDAAVRQEVAAVGYDAAFAGEQGWHERFALHRIAIGEPSAAWLAFRLHGLAFLALSSAPARALRSLTPRPTPSLR
jgi:peptidoglycan/xylan/chitin deacetylase (PgdA/CDA1 family)